MKKIERRTFTVRNMEARESDDGQLRLSGYAAVFNEIYATWHGSEETIAPGAFRKTLSEMPDVRLLINHDGLPLARTKNGTLTLTEDETGLHFEAVLADTTVARDLHTSIARGDIDQMSFAFRVIRQNWSEENTKRLLVEISLADGDVSVVTYPAYPTTSVEAREHIRKTAQEVKEGRVLDSEALAVLQSALDKMAEAELVEPVVEPVEVARTYSLRLAQAIINSTNSTSKGVK